MRVLVIEDEAETRDYLKSTLESELFVVDTAADGQDGSYKARTNEYDIVILDNMLPKKNGVDVCCEIRKAGKTMPILMLSVKSAVDDKVHVLNCGADDYMTKPYSHQELLARIRVLLRRHNTLTSKTLCVGDLSLNSDTQEVVLGTKKIYLTRKEFTILELLMRNKDKIVSRGAILEHAWDMDGDPLSKTIDMHIVHIRKKLEPHHHTYIQNVSGRGYKISQ